MLKLLIASLPFILTAHRGATWSHEENTLPAIRAACEQGYGVEFDVQSVRGGLVVVHDQRWNRTTTGRGLVRESTMAEAMALRTRGGHRIPTLADVLAVPCSHYLIHVKCITDAGYSELAATVAASGVQYRATLLDANPGRWSAVAAAAPGVRLTTTESVEYAPWPPVGGSPSGISITDYGYPGWRE